MIRKIFDNVFCEDTPTETKHLATEESIKDAAETVSVKRYKYLDKATFEASVHSGSDVTRRLVELDGSDFSDYSQELQERYQEAEESAGLSTSFHAAVQNIATEIIRDDLRNEDGTLTLANMTVSDPNALKVIVDRVHVKEKDDDDMMATDGVALDMFRVTEYRLRDDDFRRATSRHEVVDDE